MSWEPKQYLTFKEFRARPAFDLMDRVFLDSPKCIVDLGCGAGNITSELSLRWPDAQITGVDSSKEMLNNALQFNLKVTWEQADLTTWHPPQPVDLIYSNAALQWVDHHEELLPRLVSYLTSEGILAIQIPRNFSEPSHQAVSQVIQEGPWQRHLEHMIMTNPNTAEYYYTLLRPHVKTIDIWETTYLQVLQGENPVVEFLKGSYLPQFLEKLNEQEKKEFEEQYRRKIKSAYPSSDQGETLFPFRRLFIVAKGRK